MSAPGKVHETTPHRLRLMNNGGRPAGNRCEAPPKEANEYSRGGNEIHAASAGDVHVQPVSTELDGKTRLMERNERVHPL